MKKLIYSLALVVLALTSCNKWDDAITENYGEGPAITVNIAAGNPSYSAFTITVAPADGTTYYTYVYGASDEPEELDAATLLKGGYGNNVLNTKKKSKDTLEVTNAKPNTTYQVYAVACNDKGVTGKIAVASIKTTDQGAPQLIGFKGDAASKTALIGFDQAIEKGEGKVTAAYYSLFDPANPVAIEDVAVDVSGSTAKLTASAPAGAYVTFSWEAGAFKDDQGNDCAAFNSVADWTQETADAVFAHAVWYQVKNEAWAIAESSFVAPKVGGVFPKWSAFEGEITFANKVYFPTEVEDGDFVITYTNDSRTMSYKLPADKVTVKTADDMSVEKVTFHLSEATQAGDKVTVAIKSGLFYDVNGNVNASFASDKVYWISFAMTPEMAVGTFNCGITYNKEDIDLGNFSIEFAATAEKPNGLLIKNFYLEGSELDGYYDLDEGKIYIEDGQLVGMYTNSKGATYGLVFYNAENQTDDYVPVPFSVKADGTMEADVVWGIYAYNEDFSSGLGWFEIAHTTKFTPVKAAAAAKRAAKKTAKTIRVKSKLNKKFSK